MSVFKFDQVHVFSVGIFKLIRRLVLHNLSLLTH